MRHALNIFLCVAAALLLSGCGSRHGWDKDFTDNDVISLTVNKVKAFQYDPVTCQLGYNDARKEFRVSTDNMSDYFVVTLSKIPGGKDDQVTGSVTWTGDDYNHTLNNLSFEVAKMESGKIWLWNQANKLAVIIPVLE